MKPTCELLSSQNLIKYKDYYVINCNEYSSSDNIIRNINFSSSIDNVLILNDKYNTYNLIKDLDYPNKILFLNQTFTPIRKPSTFIVCPYVRYWYYYLLKKNITREKYLNVYRSLKFDLNSFCL